MDWEEITKFAEDSIDKRLASIHAALQGNRVEVNKLVSVCDSLAKHLKLNPVRSLEQLRSNASPEPKVTPKKPESRLKSPSSLKKPSEIPKKKIPEAQKAEEASKKPEETEKKPDSTLKKTESKLSLKKSIDFGGLKKKEEEEVKHKKTASSKPEDLKKIEKKELNHKEEDSKIKKIGLKPPKKPEDSEDKNKASPRANQQLKTPEEPKKKPEVVAKPSKIGARTVPQEKKSDEQIESPESEHQIIEPASFNPVPKPIKYEESFIKSKLESIPKEAHSKSAEVYSISKGVQILLHTLSKFSSEKFYLTKNDPPSEFLWIFKVVLQLLNKEPTDEQLWETIKDLLTNGKGNRVMAGIGESFIRLTEEFDFSEENLEKIEKMTAGVEIDVKKIREKCEVSGILAYLLKETLLFGAVSMEEGPNWRLLRRWEYKLSQLVSS